MKRFYELQEGVYDPGIFKAFFLAGGPGSGKSYVTSRITPGLGLKNVNSDTAFENALKKAGLSLDMPPEEEELRDVIRLKSKRLTEKQLGLYLKGRLGLVIDSTARNFVRIETAKSALTRYGYDSYCIFVNTNLDVALARNATRPRKVPVDIVKQNHKEVQENIGKLQRLFGMKNFIVIDNNKANDDVLEKAYKMIRKLVTNPPSTNIAKNWIANEIQKKKKLKEEMEFFPKDLHERITLSEPPKDLQKEADKLKRIIAARTAKDEESIRNHDENSFYAIEQYCKKHGMVFHDDEMKQIVVQAKPTIKHFKELYNVPRPHVVDSTITPMYSTTNKTKAYPSGHACQSRLVALYVSSKFPEHEDNLMEAAKECAMGRVQAGFHYLADYEAGNLLAEKMFLVMNKDNYGNYISEAPRIPRKKGQPAGSKKHSDLYTDENPKGTIHGLGFKDVETARASVKKIENSGKAHAHKIQAAIAMEQRARVMGKTQEAAIYRAYINKMKKKTKEMRKEDLDEAFKSDQVKSAISIAKDTRYRMGTQVDKKKAIEAIAKGLSKEPKVAVLLKKFYKEYKESLWANIHKKRQRIKRGSGERMRKPGEKGAPSADALKRAKGESFTSFLEKAPNTADAMKRYKAGNAGFTDKAHLKAKGLIPRADGTKKVSDKYK